MQFAEHARLYLKLHPQQTWEACHLGCGGPSSCTPFPHSSESEDARGQRETLDRATASAGGHTQQTWAGAQRSQAMWGLKRRQNDPHTQGRAVGLTRVFSCVHTYARGSLFARSGKQAGTGWGAKTQSPALCAYPLCTHGRTHTHTRTPEQAAHSPEHSWEADTRAPLPQCGSRLGAQAAWGQTSLGNGNLESTAMERDRLRLAMGTWNAQPRLSRARGKPASWRG